MAQMKTVPLIVSTWDLNAFENRSVLPAVVFVHCINLGFGHLRGPYQSSTVTQKHCINLRADTFEDYYCGLRVGELIVST